MTPTAGLTIGLKMKKSKYLPRIYDSLLSWRIDTKGAVLVEGPKWCGKTSTCEQLARSAVYMQDPRLREQYQRLAQLDPSRLLEGGTPRLIDEWQVAPKLWDAVRYEVDRRNSFGQFILTGSAVPADLDEMEHSGTGRIARMKMRPMTLMESGDSTAEISLLDLFDGAAPLVDAPDSLEELAFLICRGGWPKAVGLSPRVALQQAVDYVDAIAEVDISRVDKVNRDATKTRLLLRSYARMSASQGSLASMRADMDGGDASLGEDAFLEYVAALRKLFVIEDLPAWNVNLRSKTAVRTSPTRHFVDPSIATVALGASPTRLIGDLNTMGLLFETLCVRDLRVYAEACDGRVYHYRDKANREVDAVVVLRDGRYGLIEIKLGGDELVAEGAKSLLEVSNAIDQRKAGSPSFLMVLTGTGSFSYPREDGVLVVPLRCLGV